MLTRENYHDDTTMLSASQIKTFLTCEAQFMNPSYEDKAAFMEGRYFETLLTGTAEDIELFHFKYPYVAPKNAPDGHINLTTAAGELQANFKKVVESAEAVKRQPMLMQIINNADKQVILTGEIHGEPFRMMCDLLLPKAKSIYDLKAMKDFRKEYSERDGRYLEWWEAYNYDVQLYIYSEIAKQNGLWTENSRYGLIAATKEKTPDVKAVLFTDALLERARDKVYAAIDRIRELRAGADAMPCGVCDYCKAHKVITEFEIVGEWE